MSVFRVRRKAPCDWIQGIVVAEDEITLLVQIVVAILDNSGSSRVKQDELFDMQLGTIDKNDQPVQLGAIRGALLAGNALGFYVGIRGDAGEDPANIFLYLHISRVSSSLNSLSRCLRSSVSPSSSKSFMSWVSS